MSLDYRPKSRTFFIFWALLIATTVTCAVMISIKTMLLVLLVNLSYIVYTGYFVTKVHEKEQESRIEGVEKNDE